MSAITASFSTAMAARTAAVQQPTRATRMVACKAAAESEAATFNFASKKVEDAPLCADSVTDAAEGCAVHSAKSKCVHPARPQKDACKDCPRLKR